MVKIKRKTPQYEGGYVKEPIPGIHNNIAVLDFKSLYPSIIVTHNISPETLECEHTECKKNKAPSDSWFCKKKKGKIPKMIKKALDDRKDIKKKLKNKKLSKQERLKLEKKEQQLKLAANIAYGKFGWPKSSWYNIKCAKGISSFGRFYLQKVMEKAGRSGLKVVYGDTDSVFVKGKDVKNFVKKINKDLPGIIELEYRGLYRKGIFVKDEKGKAKKKKYALVDFRGNLLVRGFEVRRGDWCELAKKTQKRILKYILENQKEKAVEFVRKVVRDLREGKFDLKDLEISIQLSRALEKYVATSPHIAVAKKMKREGKKITEETIISYIITNKPGSISERAESSENVGKNEVDKDYYIWHQVLPAALRVLSNFGIREEDLV